MAVLTAKKLKGGDRFHGSFVVRDDLETVKQKLKSARARLASLSGEGKEP